jgi:hypothetical protein
MVYLVSLILGITVEYAGGNQEHLIFKFFRLFEGEAQGRFAITALVIIALVILLFWAVCAGA